jgi:hypothetical protein
MSAAPAERKKQGKESSSHVRIGASSPRAHRRPFHGSSLDARRTRLSFGAVANAAIIIIAHPDLKLMLQRKDRAGVGTTVESEAVSWDDVNLRRYGECMYNDEVFGGEVEGGGKGDDVVGADGSGRTDRYLPERGDTPYDGGLDTACASTDGEIMPGLILCYLPRNTIS